MINEGSFRFSFHLRSPMGTPHSKDEKNKVIFFSLSERTADIPALVCTQNSHCLLLEGTILTFFFLGKPLHPPSRPLQGNAYMEYISKRGCPYRATMQCDICLTCIIFKFEGFRGPTLNILNIDFCHGTSNQGHLK